MTERLKGVFGIDPRTVERGLAVSFGDPEIRPLATGYNGAVYVLTGMGSGRLIEEGVYMFRTVDRNKLLNGGADSFPRYRGGLIALGCTVRDVARMLNRSLNMTPHLKDEYTLGVAAFIDRDGKVRYDPTDVGIWKIVTAEMSPSIEFRHGVFRLDEEGHKLSILAPAQETVLGPFGSRSGHRPGIGMTAI